MVFLTRIRHKAVWVFLLLAGMAGPAMASDALQLAEQEIKAGLIYNFIKYTRWPSSRMAPDSPVNICIFGADPFEGYLRPLAGRSVNQREIAVRMVNSVPEAMGCHLVFINTTEKEYWPELRKLLSGGNILTVSDFQGFSAAGGMIEFARNDNRINVLLNEDAMKLANLEVEDRLLRLVTVVHSSAPE